MNILTTSDFGFDFHFLYSLRCLKNLIITYINVNINVNNKEFSRICEYYIS